jgi:hypothetical protein
MAKKPTISTISSGYASNTQLNNNFSALRTGFDNTLSLDGSTPNAMNADFDMNSNDILNANEINTSSLRLNGVLVSAAGEVDVTSSIMSSDVFTGNGSTTVYTLSFAPYIKDNTQIYIDGVYQNKITYSTSGNTLTFTEAPPLNSAIEVMVARILTDVGTADAGAVTYTQGGSGSVQTTVQAKLQESVSVKDFGATGDGVTDDTAAFVAALAAADYIHVPDGTYLIGTNLTVPVSNTLVFSGGDLIIDSGVTLTYNGGIQASVQKIFTINGTFAGKPQTGVGYPEWYGAISDGTTDDSAAIQLALDNHSRVELHGFEYGISSTLSITREQSLVGIGFRRRNSNTGQENAHSNIIMLNGFTGNGIEIGNNTTNLRNVYCRGVFLKTETDGDGSYGWYLNGDDGAGGTGKPVAYSTFEDCGALGMGDDAWHLYGQLFANQFVRIYGYSFGAGFRTENTASGDTEHTNIYSPELSSRDRSVSGVQADTYSIDATGVQVFGGNISGSFIVNARNRFAVFGTHIEPAGTPTAASVSVQISQSYVQLYPETIACANNCTAIRVGNGGTDTVRGIMGNIPFMNGNGTGDTGLEITGGSGERSGTLHIARFDNFATNVTDSKGDNKFEYEVFGAGSSGYDTDENVTVRGDLKSVGTFFQLANNSAVRRTISDGDTTPSVSSGTYFSTQNTTGTTITDFDDAVEGQQIYVKFNSAAWTINHSASIRLQGGANHTYGDKALALFFYDDQDNRWVEVGRWE